MDLKENARGRFLKVSETFTRGYSRFQVFIPADGMAEFQHNLGELIHEYDNGRVGLEKTSECSLYDVYALISQATRRTRFPPRKTNICGSKIKISISMSRETSRVGTCPSPR